MAFQLMTELVRKAEQNIDSLAAQLRNTSGPAAAAAISASGPGQQSPTAAFNDLINAARSSVEQIAGSGAGETLWGFTYLHPNIINNSSKGFCILDCWWWADLVCGIDAGARQLVEVV